jgi:hypothetical protein
MLNFKHWFFGNYEWLIEKWMWIVTLLAEWFFSTNQYILLQLFKLIAFTCMHKYLFWVSTKKMGWFAIVCHHLLVNVWNLEIASTFNLWNNLGGNPGKLWISCRICGWFCPVLILWKSVLNYNWFQWQNTYIKVTSSINLSLVSMLGHAGMDVQTGLALYCWQR